MTLDTYGVRARNKMGVCTLYITMGHGVNSRQDPMQIENQRFKIQNNLALVCNEGVLQDAGPRDT